MNRISLKPGRRGQVLIFLLMVLLILFFLAMWHFDLHKILYVKSVSQNAGDAAALAAARWQGKTLNMIGDLNIAQAMALMSEDAETAAAIADVQARLSFAGPIIGAMAAQQAAKHNRVYVNARFTEYLRDHAATVRNNYSMMFSEDGERLFPEPFENAWAEYADMLEMLCDHGIAAGPDNMRLYVDRTSGHILLHPDFYDAVNGENWCWFYLNQPGLLENYTNYRWWPALPDLLPQAAPVNSEIVGLGLQRRRVIDRLETVEAMDALRTEHDLGATVIREEIMEVEATWYVYDPAIWSRWDIFGEGSGFPVVGPVYPEYDVAGADAAIRIEAEADRLTPNFDVRALFEGREPSVDDRDSTARITWTAAAKPFGTLNGERVNEYDLVLPAFDEVRLIPIDASSAPAGGSFDLEWRHHIEEHLPLYEQHGPSVLDSGCRYCRALITWEDAEFRRRGIEWLEEFSHTCYGSGGPGGTSSGGTRRAH